MNSLANAVKTGGRNEAASLRLLSCAFTANRPLTVMGVAMLVTFLATLLGLAVDHRIVAGAPAWLKPAKFAVSIAIYCFTFIWLLTFVERRPRLVRVVAWITVASFAVEMFVIVLQAARGTTSHFNMTTPFDSFLWMTMGTFIVCVWTMNLLLAVALVLQRMSDSAFAWSLRLGVFISLVGMTAAFFMVTPRPEQVAAIRHHGPRIVGAHGVGVVDGGPGLPVLGWSTTGGDLRVAHFAGLHALQVLPALAWWLSRRKGLRNLLTAEGRLALTWTAGVAYLALVLLLLWQALRGQSVIRPDIETIFAFAALVAAAGTSTFIIFGRALSREREALKQPATIPISFEEDL